MVYLSAKRNVIQLCLATHNNLLMRKWNYVFLFLRSLLHKNGWLNPDHEFSLFIEKQTKLEQNKLKINLTCNIYVVHNYVTGQN